MDVSVGDQLSLKQLALGIECYCIVRVKITLSKFVIVAGVNRDDFHLKPTYFPLNLASLRSKKEVSPSLASWVSMSL